MKRKMILLALGGKCGALGFMGSSGSANRFSFRRAERASAPIPKPLCAKKWRRVIAFKTSSCSLISTPPFQPQSNKVLSSVALCLCGRFSLRTCRLFGRFLLLYEVDLERPDTMHLDDGFAFRPSEMPHLLAHKRIASRLQLLAGALIEFLSGSQKETSLKHGQVLVLGMPVRRYLLTVRTLDA